MHMWKKGSLTVEIALLMPIILLVWMGTVSVCLFVHNRACLTAAAYEAAVTGSWDAIRREGDAERRAEEKLQALLKNPWYGSRDIHTAVEQRGDILLVDIEGGHRSYGGLCWRFHVTGRRRSCRPVPFIREIRKAGGAGQIGGG